LWTHHFGHATLIMKLGEVFLPMIAATVVYFGVGLWLKLPAAGEILCLLQTQIPGGKAHE
jgi:hypothetical protein